MPEVKDRCVCRYSPGEGGGVCEEKAPCDKMEVQVLEWGSQEGQGEEEEEWGRKTASTSTPSDRAEKDHKATSWH